MDVPAVSGSNLIADLIPILIQHMKFGLIADLILQTIHDLIDLPLNSGNPGS